MLVKTNCDNRIVFFIFPQILAILGDFHFSNVPITLKNHQIEQKSGGKWRKIIFVNNVGYDLETNYIVCVVARSPSKIGLNIFLHGWVRLLLHQQQKPRHQNWRWRRKWILANRILGDDDDFLQKSYKYPPPPIRPPLYAIYGQKNFLKQHIFKTLPDFWNSAMHALLIFNLK